MTPPMTPREKVAAFLKERDEACGVIDADDAERDESAELILTALASGSGDHAELALNAKAAQTWTLGIYENREQAERRSKFIDSDLPATVLALLAENAALKYAVQNGNEHLEFWETRATEAERKLAEAVGLLERGQTRCSDFDHWRVVEVFFGRKDPLPSKEAERG